jgi:signal transduction histidine kinase
MQQRAERHGGELSVLGHDGTHLRWAIPLS